MNKDLMCFDEHQTKEWREICASIKEVANLLDGLMSKEDSLNFVDTILTINVLKEHLMLLHQMIRIPGSNQPMNPHTLETLRASLKKDCSK